jgi:hypothetical protein
LFVTRVNRIMLPVYSSSVHQSKGANNMRVIRNLAFAVASLAIVAVIGITVEYQPVINALAH